jgi:hypothetical protein
VKQVLQLQVEQKTSSNTAPLGITRPRHRTTANVDASWITRKKTK